MDVFEELKTLKECLDDLQNIPPSLRTSEKSHPSLFRFPRLTLGV